MKENEFLENINSIDDDLIFEAENWIHPRLRNLKILSGIAAAAAACLCFAAGLSVGASREKVPAAGDTSNTSAPAMSGSNVDNSADNSSDALNDGTRVVGCSPSQFVEIYPTIMVNGKLYEWKLGNAIIDDWDLPKGCVYRGKILYMPGKTIPEDEREFVADYKASGLVFTDPEEDLVYLEITTDWLDNKFVVFESVENSVRLRSDPAEIWYKKILTAYSPNGMGNAFDYTELSELIPQIAPKDRKALLDLSEEQIDSMTTAELLVTCLDYPLFGDMYAYGTNANGFAALVERYNGLQALLAREDAGEVLAAFYCAADLKAILQTDEYSTLRYDYLNAMLSYGDLLNSVSAKTRRELFYKCVSDYDTINGHYSEILNSFPIARIAVKILYMDSPEFKEFAESSSSVMNFISGSGLIKNSEETWRQVEYYVRSFAN